MDYTFETTSKDEEGNDVTEEHKLSEFAKKEDANSIARRVCQFGKTSRKCAKRWKLRFIIW